MCLCYNNCIQGGIKMKFDSSTYLYYVLEDKAKILCEYAKYCTQILDGFEIAPGSINYNKKTNEISFVPV